MHSALAIRRRWRRTGDWHCAARVNSLWDSSTKRPQRKNECDNHQPKCVAERYAEHEPFSAVIIALRRFQLRRSISNNALRLYLPRFTRPQEIAEIVVELHVGEADFEE